MMHHDDAQLPSDAAHATAVSGADDELAQRLLDAEGLLRATGGEGDARVKRAIEEGVDSLEEILDAFPFELDRFQQQAVRALLEQSSVVVCAPTGAGKTAIAEAAAIACLAKGKRAIYTTPLKALR